MKILVGYKGTNVGQDLLELAALHADAFSAEVLVVTSMREGAEEEQTRINEAEENLEKAQAFFKDKSIACQTHLLIRGLDAGEDLLSFAREKGADEIIIGVKSRSKVGKLLFGSTAQSLILQATCPVVTVR